MLGRVCLNKSLADFTVFNTGAESSEQETQSLCIALLSSASIILPQLILKEQRPLDKLQHLAGLPMV